MKEIKVTVLKTNSNLTLYSLKFYLEAKNRMEYFLVTKNVKDEIWVIYDSRTEQLHQFSIEHHIQFIVNHCGFLAMQNP